MNNTSSASSLPSYAYVSCPSNYGTQYSKVDIVKSTAKHIRVVSSHNPAFVREFSLRNTGEWLESGKIVGRDYRVETLELDVVSVEKILADRAARWAFRGKANDARKAIEAELQGHMNGFGDYCGGEEGLARMELALSILRGEDNVH